jgi:hypothetical protein
VLYEFPNPALYIFDKRDHVDPKYIIRTENISIQTMDYMRSQELIENIRDGAFQLSTRSRKVTFSSFLFEVLFGWPKYKR